MTFKQVTYKLYLHFLVEGVTGSSLLLKNNNQRLKLTVLNTFISYLKNILVRHGKTLSVFGIVIVQLVVAHLHCVSSVILQFIYNLFYNK